MGPRAVKRLTLDVQAGKDFVAGDVEAGSAMIRVKTLIDGIIVGGMSYLVDPTLREPAREHEGGSCGDGSGGEKGIVKREAGGLIKCLGIDLPEDCVESVDISKITIEIGLCKKPTSVGSCC
jgi:hypothetical protein